MLCLNADNVEEELQVLTPEDAAQLRSQMEDLLKRADEARAVSASNEEAMRYGREMWARCEALTAGAFLPPLYGTCLSAKLSPLRVLMCVWRQDCSPVHPPFSGCMLPHDQEHVCDSRPVCCQGWQGSSQSS